MREIDIRLDNPEFLVEQQRSGDGKVPPLRPDAMARLPAGAYVLIGNRSAAFGGGLASTGYVIVGGKAIGTVSGVRQQDVQRGSLIVK